MQDIQDKCKQYARYAKYAIMKFYDLSLAYTPRMSSRYYQIFNYYHSIQCIKSKYLFT